MEHGKQEVQPSIPLGRTWSKLPEDMYQRDRLQGPYGNYQRLESHQAVQTPVSEGKQDKGEPSHYPSYRRTAYPDRAYSDFFRLTRSRKFPGEDKDTRAKTRPLSTKGRESQTQFSRSCLLGERSKQEPEIAIHTSRISSPINGNITPTQTEHNSVTPESSLNSDVLWLQMSQFAEKTQKQFVELRASHERMKTLTASMDKIVKTLQEGHAQLSKASEETNKSLNQVFEEPHHKKGTGIAKKKVYAIEKAPEEESPTEDSESNSMGDAIREQSDEDKDPREEFLVEYQEESPLEIQEIQLEAGMPQDTANKILFKHTQDAQTLLVKSTKGMEYIHGKGTKMSVCIDNAQHPLIIESGAHF
ncbi:hypothetical protein O181_000228 [Austropuccinia psidii MF-1]|uniref:Uncharacterized protein n=1 Tax=Austropuccinia psidii MF-1 TaxID=1389203 RepID=A0A9Q3B8E9_9BASI|nr:hypothetical protein [Austropuccinia psidii MF-1]